MKTNVVLKLGIAHFLLGSAGVIYRLADLTYSTIPSLRWFCLSGLAISLACFAIVYTRAEACRFAKVIPQEPDMIKSSLWKSSSMA